MRDWIMSISKIRNWARKIMSISKIRNWARKIEQKKAKVYTIKLVWKCLRLACHFETGPPY